MSLPQGVFWKIESGFSEEEILAIENAI